MFITLQNTVKSPQNVFNSQLRARAMRVVPLKGTSLKVDNATPLPCQLH